MILNAVECFGMLLKGTQNTIRESLRDLDPENLGEEDL